MNKRAQRRLAEEAARLMAYGVENEYLQAKERAMMMLGLSDQTRMPSNKMVNECVARLTKSELGPEEVKRRLHEMREIAVQIMSCIDDFDPFLIGSVLTGKIRDCSDIDLHAYCENYEELKDRLAEWEYDSIDEEIVQNRKGTFVHLKWTERTYPVEITIYPWDQRDVVQISSVTLRPMKRADLVAVQKLLKQS
jgi:predicted nucleotidyltransferase